MLEVIILEDDLRSLQAVLSINNPELPVLDSWSIFFRGTGSETLWHNAHSLPIPLHVIHQVVYLPLDTSAFT